MSNRALTWAFEQAIDNVGAKFVLVALADHATDHAGEDWTCFPSSERLAAFTSMPTRTLERHIAWLVEHGWISREAPRGKRGRMQVRHYRLHRERPATEAATGPDEASPPANLAGGEEGATTRQNGASPPAKNGGHHPPPVAGGYIAEPPEEPSITPTSRARAREIQFHRCWEGWPDAGKRGVSSPRLGRAAFDRECDAGAEPERVAAAMLRYAADRSAWGVSGRPAAFHRFLDEGRHDAFMGSPPSGLAEALLAGRTAFAGPEGLRGAVVDGFGETAAASYLDPCGWDEAGGVVIARTRTAATWLSRNMAGALVAAGVRVEFQAGGA